ncbi:hypothetical protein ACHAWX_000854 [Stephanocyclus meneghinianus]
MRLVDGCNWNAKEGRWINQSRATVLLKLNLWFVLCLLTLSKVLISLDQNNPGHINYRDSKLTCILKPSLSDYGRMAVICCISPSDKFIEETRSTLQFVTRAKLVKMNAVAIEVVESDAGIIEKLRIDMERSQMKNWRIWFVN